MCPCQGTTIINTSLEPISPEFTTPSSPISLYEDIATSLILQPVMSVEEKLAQTLTAMERMEKLMEALNRDLEGVKEENQYLKAVADTNNDQTNPDHPLYQEPAEGSNLPPPFTFHSHHRGEVTSPPQSIIHLFLPPLTLHHHPRKGPR